METLPLPGATPELTLPVVTIDTDLYTVTFTNQGATVRSWLLKGFKGNDSKPLELVNTASNTPRPFALSFPGDKPAKDVNWTWYTQTPDPDGLGVTYEYSDGHTKVRKSFKFQKNSHLSKVSSEVTIDGKPVAHRIEWRGGFGDLTVPTPAMNGRTLYFDVAENKLNEKAAGDAKNGPVMASGNFSFAGLADNYFAAVFLPAANASLEVVTVTDYTPTALEQKADGFPGVAISQGAENSFELFVGPEGSRSAQEGQPEADAGGGFRLVLDSRQAAVPDRQLVQQRVRAQLRLVHRPGDGHPQLHALPAEDVEHEVDAEDAGAASRKSTPSTTSTKTSK